MKSNIILLITAISFAFGSSALANTKDAPANKTVMESVKDLGASLKTATKAKIVEAYDNLSAKVDALKDKMKGEKDESYESIKAERDTLKSEFDSYKASVEDKDEKAEEMRQGLIKKLDDLNEKIEKYNADHKAK